MCEVPNSMNRVEDPEPVKEPKPNWAIKCQVCETVPTIDDTKLCGVCTFGEADMADWWEKP